MASLVAALVVLAVVVAGVWLLARHDDAQAAALRADYEAVVDGASFGELDDCPVRGAEQVAADLGDRFGETGTPTAFLHEDRVNGRPVIVCNSGADSPLAGIAVFSPASADLKQYMRQNYFEPDAHYSEVYNLEGGQAFVVCSRTEGVSDFCVGEWADLDHDIGLEVLVESPEATEAETKAALASVVPVVLSHAGS